MRHRAVESLSSARGSVRTQGGTAEANQSPLDRVTTCGPRSLSTTRGSLAADGVQNIAVFPWQLICPGVTMAVTLFSLNFLGDGLRDALDPQMRKG